MSAMIQARGNVYYVSEEPEVVKGRIERGEFVEVWWFAAWGQRYTERAWFSPDVVEMIRSEHDDG